MVLIQFLVLIQSHGLLLRLGEVAAVAIVVLLVVGRILLR